MMAYYTGESLSHKAWLALLPNTFNRRDQLRAKTYWCDCCAYCGRTLFGLPLDVGWDHFIPIDALLDNPGTTRDNMLPCCRQCNAEKAWRYPLDFLEEAFGFEEAQVILAKINVYFASLKEDS